MLLRCLSAVAKAGANEANEAAEQGEQGTGFGDGTCFAQDVIASCGQIYSAISKQNTTEHDRARAVLSAYRCPVPDIIVEVVALAERQREVNSVANGTDTAHDLVCGGICESQTGPFTARVMEAD